MSSADRMDGGPMPHINDRSPDPAESRYMWPPLLIVLISCVVVALVAVDAPAVVRAGPVLLYIATVPGLACVRLIRTPDRLTTLLLGVGLSLALGTIVAVAMLYLRWWSPTLGVATLATTACAAAAVEVFRTARTARRAAKRVPS
jgi:hypothetical protein